MIFSYGALLTFLTMLFWAIEVVVNRHLIVDLGAQPYLTVTVQSFIGAFVLIIIGGKGTKSLESLKHPHTWLYSALQILMNMGTVASFVYITSTQSMLLQRVNIIAGLIIGLIVLGRKVNRHDFIGMLIIGGGIASILSGLSLESAIGGMIAVLFASFCHIGRTHVAERHAVGSDVKTFGEHCRFVGYVLLSTSFVFLLLYIAGFKLGQIAPGVSWLPSSENALTKDQLIVMTFIGLTLMPVAKYCFFKSARHLKTENFLVLTAYIPVITLVVEKVASYFGFLPGLEFTLQDILGTVLIVGGASYIALKRKNPEKLYTERQKIEMENAKEQAYAAMVHFDGNVKKAAEGLEVSVESFSKIMQGKELLPHALYKRIKQNFDSNVISKDPVTGLQTRLSFMTKLNKRMANAGEGVLFLIDLNKFKPVNDTYGHAAGDKVLSTIASRLRDSFGHLAEITRLGGDEYCLYFYKLENTPELVIENIRSKLEEPVYIEDLNQSVSVSGSIGLASYPDDAQSAEELLAHADKSMYREKSDR